MKEKLLQWLACPVCKSGLSLEVAYRKENEIVEGKLRCTCGQLFPIIGGVPRLLSGALKDTLPHLYPDFFQRHSDVMDYKTISPKNRRNSKIEATMDRFGYEWEHFSDYACNNFKPFTAPLPDDFFTGKLGLDAGCGAGRHAEQASKKGAEVIGIDLSKAVDAAQQNNLKNEQVHVVQADIYNLPFHYDSFHFIYSLGVIQHLPEPERGYQTLPPFLKQGGALFIWVYAYAIRKVMLEILRLFSQRLSNDNLRRMAYFCNIIDYGVLINSYRLTKNIPFLGNRVKRYSPSRIKEYASYGFRVGYADWFDRLSAPITNYYRESEMQNWLVNSGLTNTKLLPEGDSWWWLYGEKDKK